MSYSRDEKTAAVEELVQGTLSFQQDPLGSLNQSTQLAEVMETVYSAFLYDSDAIYYLIYLVRHTLKRIINAEDALCDELLDAIDDLAMPNRPVNDISGLTSARNSLQAVDFALNRSGSVSGSEFRRYQQALTRFKQQLGRTVRMTYVPRGTTTPVTDVVRPSSQAKFDATTYFSSTKEEHVRLLQQLEYLQGTLSGFSVGKLPAKIGRRQILRAKNQLDDLEQKLEGLTAEERIAEARSALLTILANESVVKALAEHPAPGTAKLRQRPSASPLYRLSAHGEGLAPSVMGAKSAPWPLYDSLAASPTNMLGFADLNGLPLDVDLFPISSPSYKTGIMPAEITGMQSGDFAISVDLVTPYSIVSTAETWNTLANGNIFHIIVDGVAYECTLTQNAVLGAAAAKVDLDTVGNWKGNLRPEITVTITGSNELSVAYSVVAPPPAYGQRHMMLTQGFGYPQDMWPWTVDPGTGPIAATRSDGWDQNNNLWVKANDDPAHVVVTLPSGNWPDYLVTAASVAAAIDAAGGSEFTADVDSFDRVRILSERHGEGSIITLLSSGMRPPGDPSGRAGFPTPSFAGLQRLGFVSGQECREADIDGLTVVNIINRDAALSAQVTARMVRTNILFGNNAVRSADQVLDIPMASDPRASWADYGELKVAISSGDNRGIYSFTAAPTYSAGALHLPLSRKLRDNTADLLHTCTVYKEVLELESTDAGLTGVVELTDPADSARAVLGLDADVHSAVVGELLVEKLDSIYGWRPMDLSRLKIRVSDVVLDGGGSAQATLTSTSELENGVLIVEAAIAPSFELSTQGFSIQSGAYVAYLAFMNALETWVAVTLPPFEEDLSWIDQALGPILLTTPSADRVSTAYTRVSMLKTKLEALTTLLDDFVVARVPAVDSALQALLEHGYDRARQLLITGQTTAFFEVTGADVSFSRAFQTAVNEVVVQDVNQGSQARARFDAEFVRLRGSWEEDKHPDYDFSDLEEEPPDDAVVDYYQGVDEFEGT